MFVTAKPTANVDLKNLSEVELEIVVQVIQKDFELKAAEKARLRRHQKHLKDYDKRVNILSSSNFNDRFCVICFQQFFFLIIPKRLCYSCRHSMCNSCSVWIPILKAFICMLCQKERNLKSMGCDWYYGLLKSRFQQDGSEIVAQSLYKNQSQWYTQLADSIVTPDLLRKVKGAQISRYREKIHAQWEEMQKKLVELDRNVVNKAKKDESWHILIEEYKTIFRDILKEFSQYLYITLENYASKIEDPNLNINEQVITTVYEEVELMTGYKVKCVGQLMSDEMGSVLSDMESTTSIFVGNQMEEKLAGVLVNKVIRDHSLNEFGTYDIEGMDDLQPDDESSSASYIFQPQPYKNDVVNGTISEQSSTFASSFLDNEASIEINRTHLMQYSSPLQTHLPADSISTLEDGNDSGDVLLSTKELQNILRQSSSDRRSYKQYIERRMKVPYGDPIKLQVQITGIPEQGVTWTKTQTNQTEILFDEDNTEITEVLIDNFSSFNLRKWQTTGRDAGVYTALISNKPVAEFTVNIIVNKQKSCRPTFRLKMLNCSCRTSQVGEFSVEALGYPEPRIQFYHKSTLISKSSDKYRIEFRDQISRYTLKILNVTGNDHGTYKCVATNSSGTSECSAQLQVTNVHFRFEKLPRSSSNSSVEDEAFRYPPVRKPDSVDGVDEPLNELVEIHQHLMYLEWQLDWFEEQTSMDHIKTPKSTKSPISTKDYSSKTPMRSQSNIGDYSTLYTMKNQSVTRDFPSPNSTKNQDYNRDYPSPNSTKIQVNTKNYPPTNTTRNQGHTRDYQSPNSIPDQESIRDYSSPNTSNTPGYTRDYPSPNSTTNQDYSRNYPPPNSTKNQSYTRDYPSPNPTKNQGDTRNYPPSNSIKNQDDTRNYNSPNSYRNQGTYKRTPPPDTVIGREIPDEFQFEEREDSTSLRRPNHSFSTPNIDNIHNLSRSSREEAMRTSRSSLGNSNSNISRLKLLFEQPEFPKVHGNSSITGRTPRSDSRRSQSPFTKEVRVSHYEPLN